MRILSLGFVLLLMLPHPVFALRPTSENPGLEEQIGQALTPAPAPSAGQEENVDRIVYPLVNEKNIFAVPPAVLGILRGREGIDVEAVTVNPHTAVEFEAARAAILFSLSAKFQPMAVFSQAQQQEIGRRLLIPGAMLVRADISPDRLEDTLVHEEVQRIVYGHRERHLIDEGLTALFKEEDESLVQMNRAIGGRLSGAEFAAQWARTAGVFSDKSDYEKWRAWRKTLRQRAQDPHAAASMDLRVVRMIHLIDDVITPAAVQSVGQYIGRISEGLQAARTSMILEPVRPSVLARPLLPPDLTRRRVSDDPLFIKQMLRMVLQQFALQVSQASGKEVTSEQLQAWLAKQSILLLGDDHQSEAASQLRQNGVTQVVTLQRGQMGGRWAEHHDSYRCILSILSLNSTRVPQGEREDVYWGHVARETEFALASNGFMLAVIPTGNETLEALWRDSARHLFVESYVGNLYLVTRAPIHDLLARIGEEISAAGQEEKEVMPANEFGQRYYSVMDSILASLAGVKRKEWMARGDVEATVVNLPQWLYIYVQGTALFWSVQNTLSNLSPEGSRFVILPVPRDGNWPGKVGLIFQDPMVDPITPEENPFELPVYDLRFEDVPKLDPFDVIAKIFRSRLEIPESKYLGGMVFRDAEGQAKLVLFSA